MPFAGGGGIVAIFFEDTGESGVVGWEREVEFTGARIMRIAPGHDTAAAGAARAGGEKGVVKSETGFSELVDMG